MKENLLQFIWKLKLFSKSSLKLVSGKDVEIISVGSENTNSGPDFFNAKIKINNQLWAGTVEIHIKSSNWYHHNHHLDRLYNAVILHVVWEHDVEVFDNNNEVIETLVLKNYVQPSLIDNYRKLFTNTIKWINCENSIGLVDNFNAKNWFEVLFFERLAQKSFLIEDELKISRNNWEAVLFVLLAKNFGMKVNNESFRLLANSFDFKLVRKLSNNQLQLEALFFGQAGLLSSNYEDAYFRVLKEEYLLLQQKYHLKPLKTGVVQFYKLRPNNFPTIRLSQLATLYSKHQSLVYRINEINSLDGFYNLFTIGTSNYWQTHYTFKTVSKKSSKILSKSFIDLLIINTIIPFKFAYNKHLGTTDFNKLLDLINVIKPEKNAIITKFNDLKVKSSSALESQALLQLKNEYCSKMRCLECAIGKTILMR